MGAGVLEVREPKSVMVGIWRRGQWDVIGNRGNKGALEIEVIEDPVMYGCEPLEFELDVLCTEPLKENDFVVMQERSLEDVSNSLVLLCVCRQVVDVAGNGGLNVRYVTYVKLFLD